MSIGPSDTLSRTESDTSWGTWGRNAAFGGTRNAPGSATVEPFQRTSPVTADFHPSPRIALRRVDLPDPTGPVTTVKLPRGTTNEIGPTPEPSG